MTEGGESGWSIRSVPGMAEGRAPTIPCIYFVYFVYFVFNLFSLPGLLSIPGPTELVRLASP
jgi:hypothetical protein